MQGSFVKIQDLIGYISKTSYSKANWTLNMYTVYNEIVNRISIILLLITISTPLHARAKTPM